MAESFIAQLPVGKFHGIRNATEAKMHAKNLSARALTVKIKYHDFEQITRSQTADNSFDNIGAAMKIIRRLLQTTDTGRRKVRLLGVTLSNLEQPEILRGYRQLDLFTDL